MTSTPEHLQRLNNCQNGVELRTLVSERCAGCGEVLNITLLCSKQTPDELMCVVDFVPDASNVSLCAMALGGRIFGFNSVVFNLTPSPEFTCTHGFPPVAASCSCTPRR